MNLVKSIHIPNLDKWETFYSSCIKNNNFNIACVGPHDSGKSTLLQCIMNYFTNTYPEIKKDKLIFCYNQYQDLSLHQSPNELTIFCQNHINSDKLVYIENFDDLNEQSQQELKAMMDKYFFFKNTKKVHFIIESKNIFKIKEFLKSRFQLFHTQKMNHNQLFAILKEWCKDENIQLDDKCMSFIKNNTSINATSLKLFIEKMKLLNITYISYMSFYEYYQCFDESIFSSYFSYINDNNHIEANKLLLSLFDDGYDLSDILYFLYSYVKTKEQLYFAIEIICYYINEYYNGRYHKFFIILLTHDIQKKKEGLI